LAEPALLSFTAGDGYAWKYRRYESAGPPRTSVVLLHGIQSHGGWYDRTCRELAAAGHTVSFLDRRGCGLNDRDRGDAPRFRRLLDDVAEFLAAQPRPRIVVGISWGGKLAVGLQRRHPGVSHGLVLIAPGLCPRVRPPLSERLWIVASRFMSPGRPFPIPLNDPDLFTANAERRQFIHDDPLALRTASARLLFESGRMDVYLRFAARHMTVPALVLLAEHDRIIDNARTRRFIGRFPTTDTTVIDYPNSHHTLEFEPGGPPFLADLTGWLSSPRFARHDGVS
jgi:alpha-beta hydrolase superfamily lysophospholipase